MSTTTDTYRRVGRGGAGNFLSKKDLDDASARTQQSADPEAQTPSSPTADPVHPHQPPSHATPPPSSSAPGYARSGRGGSGNFHEPATIADSLDAEDAVERTRAAVGAALARGRPGGGGLTGRGGVGNWKDDGTHSFREREEDRKAREMEARIEHDVDAGLKMPARTYHQHDRDVDGEE